MYAIRSYYGDKQGDVARILSETGTGRVLGYNEIEGLSPFFDSFTAGLSASNSDAVKNYSREKLTEKLVSILNHM